MAPSNSITIVSHPGDMHVDLVAAYLKKRHGALVEHVAPLAAATTITLRYHPEKSSFDEHRRNLIWVRRRRMLRAQAGARGNLDEALNTQESNECVIEEFILRNADRSINHPVAAIAIENKATQLRLAAVAGLLLPDTIISANYGDVVEFSRRHERVIIKSLRPLGYNPTGTFDLDRSLLSESDCSCAAAIYQEKIGGALHYRVVVFGSEIHAFRYRSDHTDSRFDMREAAERVHLGPSLEAQVVRFMGAAGLRMGILDFKEGLDGQLYFLEINQQGSFAYLDPLANYPLLRYCADFLAHECVQRANDERS